MSVSFAALEGSLLGFRLWNWSFAKVFMGDVLVAVVEYEIREIERLKQANSRLARFEREQLSGSNPRPSTGDGCS